MRNYILFLLFSISITCGGQTNINVSAGPVIAYTQYSTPAFSNFKLDPGFSVGIDADIAINSTITFKPGLKFIKLVPDENGFIEVVTGSQFLQIPLLAKLKIEEGFHFLLGPQVMFSLDKNSISRNVDELTPTNLGLSSGFGFESEKFSMEARHGFQLNNYYENDENTSKLSMLNVNLGFKF